VALTAADKMNDFEAIVRLDASLAPLRARKDFEIPLDGHAACSHSKVSEHRFDGQPVGHFAALAVNHHRDHGGHPEELGGELVEEFAGDAFDLFRIVKRISSLPASAFA